MFTLEFRLKSNGALTPEKKIQAALVIASSLYEVNFNTTGATQVFLAEQRKDLLLEFKVIDQTSSRNPSKQGELALVITCQNIGANEATPDLVVNFIRAILVETELNQLFELALTKLAGLEKHNQLGVEFYKVQQYAEAAIFFEKACHLAKNDDERLTPLFNWGKALSALKKAQEASEKFKAVLALDENLKTNPKIKLKHQEAYADNLKIIKTTQEKKDCFSQKAPKRNGHTISILAKSVAVMLKT